MIGHARPVALTAAAAAALVLAACSSGGSSGSQPAAQSQLARISAATHPSATSTAPQGPTIDAATVDVCSLLTAADANRVAHAEQLDEFQTASEVYVFTARKQADPKGASCLFRITAPNDDGQGEAVFHVRPATGFVVPPDGEPISGLGDEAYDTGDSPVVRVGTVTLSSDENSFPDAFTVALLRAMVPRLK